MLLAAFFLTAGIFRIVAALHYRFPNWGWAIVDGLVMSLLGAFIWAEWPSSALWVIGTFIGVSLLLCSLALVMFAFGIRQWSKTSPTA